MLDHFHVWLLSKSINLGNSNIIYNKKKSSLSKYYLLLKEVEAMDKSRNTGYQAGQAKGQAQVS